MIKLLGKTNLQGKTIFATDLTPTYTITRSASSVNEGSSVTFTLSTTNVANGTVLPYTISGISSTDVTTGSLTGSFTVNSGLATATITMSADQLTEGAETATLTLNNAAASSFVVVNDTSTTPVPLTISGLQLWLDASDTSTLYDATAGGSLVTTDGAAVARWADKSGNNRHAIQTTSNARPLLRTGVNGINSKTILSFDGSNDFLTSSVTGFKNLSAVSVIGVISTAVAAQADIQTMIWFGFGNAGNAGSGFPAARGLGISSLTGALNGEKITFLADNASFYSGRLGSTTYSRTANTAQSLQLELGSTGTQLYANNSSVNLNLANQISTSTNLAPNQIDYTLDDNLLLGAIRANGSVLTSGVNQKMAEFLVFNRKLTSGERSTLWSYLQTKWNIA